VRVTFLSDNFPPETNAPASRLYEHATRWVRAGHSVTVITCAPNFPTGRVFAGYRNAWRTVQMMDGIRVVRVKTFITANEGFLLRTLDYISFMISSFIAGLFEKRPDVVVATSPQFFCAVGGCLLALVKRRPFVLEVRDMWPDSIVAVGVMRESVVIRMLRKLEMFLYRQARAIVVVTSSFKKQLARRGIDPSKIHVVYNGADLDWCHAIPRDEALAQEYNIAGKFTVGYFGTLGLAHGLHKVLDAAALLRHRIDIVFLFVGAGAQARELKRRAAEMGLDNVRFGDTRPKSDMSRLWSLCDVALIVLANREVYESVIPSKLFEATAHEVPVLMALPRGEATGIVEAAGIGTVVAPEQPQALAHEVERLAKGQALAAMRVATRLATPGFSREVQAERMLKILEQTQPVVHAIGQPIVFSK
jgi:glycosyltransferase involved in cell wall biosynthesis